jgi:hypothetical protein
VAGHGTRRGSVAASRRVKGLTTALVVLMGPGLAATPASAGTAGAAPARALSLSASAEARVAALDASGVVAATQGDAPRKSNSDRPFFKTRKGIVVLVLMAAVATYTVVSRSRDAVHSPTR